MNIVFMGTPAFALPSLRALAQHHDVLAAYTRADAASGRGKAPVPTPVSLLAQERGIPVCTPRSFYAFAPDGAPLLGQHGGRVVDAQAVASLAALAPDFIVVVAYGLILPQAVIDIPRYGCINVHGSILPRWRGAAPIQRALLANDGELGVSIMRIDKGIDTGDYCAVATTPAAHKAYPELVDELGTLGAQALIEALPAIAAGTAAWIPQDDAQATSAPKLAKDELWPAPALTAAANVLRVRASSPQAPARCIIAGKPVAILGATADSHAPSQHEREDLPGGRPLEPGQAAFLNKRLYLAAADGVFEVLELKPNGKNAMSAPAFAAGCKALQAPNQPATWSRL